MPVQFLAKYKKTLAIEMRSKGSSYSEIKKELSVPKSTLSFWLKNLKLTPGQKKVLREHQREAIQAGAKKRILKFSESLEEIKNSALKDIKKVSQREFWLLGLMLCRGENDPKRGVRFTSTDPHLIKLFLKWLKEIGGIKSDEIVFDIFTEKAKSADTISYWSKITSFPESFFSHIYFLSKPPFRRKSKRRTITKKSNFGLLRIRVKASSLLARQITWWSRGLINIIKSTKFNIKD